MAFLSKLRSRHGREVSSSDRQDILASGQTDFDKYIKYINSQFNEKNRKISIGVIGGGFSGLYSAWLLRKMGYTVKVFEASHRLGGRVHTFYDFSPGRVIEAGAEYIGLNHMRWLGLARYFGLGLKDVREGDHEKALDLTTTIVIGGKSLDRLTIEKVEKKMNKLLIRISVQASIITYPSQPWLEPKEIQALDEISVGQVLDTWNIDPLVRKVFDILEENDMAASLYNMSWLGYLCLIKGGSVNSDPESYWDLTEVFTCANGNQTLAKCLADEIGHKNILLNTPVNEVCKRRDEFIVKSGHNEDRFDYLILAIPPTVWKRITFSPRINLNKYRPKTGPAIKYMATVERRFWINNGISANGLNSQAGELWEQTINQTIGCKQFINLAVFSGGRYAAENLASRNTERRIRVLANDNFEGQLVQNLKYDFVSSHPDLKYVRTGYSYIGIRKATTTSKLLNRPVKEYDNKMFWGGEHVSVSFYGFMEGALDGGEIAVNLFIRQLRDR